MPEYVVTDPETGRKVKMTGDQPPTGEQIRAAFASLPPQETTPEIETTPEGRSFLENVGRGVGLTARNVAKAPGVLADFGASVVNAADRGLQNVFGFDNPDLLPTNSAEFTDQRLTEAGLPVPETPLERIGSDIQNAALFAATPIKVGGQLAKSANPVTSGVGTTLAANPGIQGVSAAASGGGTSAVREAGGSPGQQLAAGLTGALAPSVAVTVAPAVVRQTLRGSGETLRQNIDTFGRAGTTPTLGQGTQGRIAQATESLLSRSPGGAGQFANKGASQADDVARRVEQIADDLAPKATAERAGRAIETGITAKGGFVERFKTQASKLYDDVDQHVDVDGPAKITNTTKFLDDVTAPAAGAEETSKLLSSKFLSEVRDSLGADIETALANGVDGLPYSTLKALRTLVGKKIDNLTLISDVSKGELKQLYGALSDDLTAYAGSQASPKALAVAKRADAFYKAGIHRIENIERVVNKNGGPEKVFNAAVAGTKEGATVLRTIMKSLKPEEQKMVSAAVVRRMGKATPGVQDATGEAFSINTYLTNWAKLSPEARGTLFGRHGAKFQRDMDALADFASNVRSGSGVFSNPSGTQQALTLQATSAGTVAAAAFGQFEVAATLGGIMVGSNIMARAMTSPNFVKWLAAQTTIPAGSYAAQVNALGRMATETNDRDLALMVGLLQEQQENATNQDNGGQNEQ